MIPLFFHFDGKDANLYSYERAQQNNLQKQWRRDLKFSSEHISFEMVTLVFRII